MIGYALNRRLTTSATVHLKQTLGNVHTFVKLSGLARLDGKLQQLVFFATAATNVVPRISRWRKVISTFGICSNKKVKLWVHRSRIHLIFIRRRTLSIWNLTRYDAQGGWYSEISARIQFLFSLRKWLKNSRKYYETSVETLKQDWI